MQPGKDDKHIDLDLRGNPLMTARTIAYFCVKEGLFTTPQLNDRLYLNFKGFARITDSMALYPNLKVLWLNNNAIAKIEALQFCPHLNSLHLDHNNISSIEGLQDLQELHTLTLSHNRIQCAQNLQLPSLTTLSLANNFLHTADALEGCSECPCLSSLDLSHNDMEATDQVVEVILNNKNLSCLYLKATPLSRGLRNYRKTFIGGLKQLKFLDDRPVSATDHRLAEAWLQRGIEGETEQKAKIKNEVANQPSTANNVQDVAIEKKQATYQQPEVEEEEEENAQTALRKTSHKYIEKQEPELHGELDEHQSEEKIASRVNQVLRRGEYRVELGKWKPKYERLLQGLLIRYKFDFGEVQPSFNMALKEVSKRLGRPCVRFEVTELQHAWTAVELRRRSAQ